MVLVYLPIFISYHDNDYREWNGMAHRFGVTCCCDWFRRKSMWKKREENFRLHSHKGSACTHISSFFLLLLRVPLHDTAHSTTLIGDIKMVRVSTFWWMFLYTIQFFLSCSFCLSSLSLVYICIGWRFFKLIVTYSYISIEFVLCFFLLKKTWLNGKWKQNFSNRDKWFTLLLKIQAWKKKSDELPMKRQTFKVLHPAK